MRSKVKVDLDTVIDLNPRMGIQSQSGPSNLINPSKPCQSINGDLPRGIGLRGVQLLGQKR